jgi:hypothetical protein
MATTTGHSINTGPYGENTEIYSSLKLLHWLNLNCASIIGRSFTNFCVFYVDRNFKMTTTAGHSFYIGPIGFFLTRWTIQALESLWFLISVYKFIFNKISFFLLLFHLFFPYFNLFVSIFIQSYVNIKLHVSTLYRYKAWNSAGLKIVHLLVSSTFIAPYFHYVIQTRTCIHSYKTHLFAPVLVLCIR